jgi:hypothetical protein
MYDVGRECRCSNAGVGVEDDGVVLVTTVGLGDDGDGAVGDGVDDVRNGNAPLACTCRRWALVTLASSEMESVASVTVLLEMASLTLATVPSETALAV